MNDYAQKPSQLLFWGCFIALITTSFAFFTRMYLCDVRFGTDFNIDKVDIGSLKGAGVWPFAISIILFSLVIDRIGYRTAMFFSFVCYSIYLVMAWLAYTAIQGVSGEALVGAQQRGFSLLYWGSIILALGNGTVEAFINPVVATMFSREKTKWLNILHAGWPGGLVIAGMITIMMADTARTGDWRLVLGLIAIPAVLYLIILARIPFPRSEREQAGVSYREMLAEFGAFGALVGFGLIFMQLAEVFGWNLWIAAALTLVVAVLFGVQTGSFGRPILAFLIIIMMPLAITEIGTDGWISGLMEAPMEAAGYNAGWVLVYTSAIMMVLRFFAGPIVHRLSPIGLLIASAVLAIVGLLALSRTGSSGLAAIMIAASLYGVGKTFFWPTMLGITAEQCPKGGALTLNAIAGIGMIAVGVLGFPFIGALQERTASAELRATSPEGAEQVLVEKRYMGITYAAIHPERARDVTSPETRQALEAANQAGQFDALAKMAWFPGFMLVCYLGLFMYFRSRGGYTAVHLTADTDLTHPSHGEGPGIDRHVTADEAYADGIVGPNE
jgi:MFS family permease